jgi:excisionase family DNA binding protein
MPNSPDLIGSTEAARILGKSLRTVHRMVLDGKLTPEFTAPGGPHGAHLFKRADVEALAEDAVA